MATEGLRVGPAAVAERAVGGADAAFALLAEAFARRGHALELRAGALPAGEEDGLPWSPLEPGGAPATLAIASRAPRLFRRLPPGRRVLWLLKPGSYLRKSRHLLPLLAARPKLVVLGPAHAATLPRWLPFRPVQIPLAPAPAFAAPPAPRNAPPPVAVFTSNPLRGLDWLLELWAARIQPAVPGAELHLYTGAATHGGNARSAARVAPVLARAASLDVQGVRLRQSLPRPALAARLREARLMLHRGDAAETFCLALAEAQALGLPAVATRGGAAAERVADGVTGVLARDEEGFAQAAIRLLSDDAAWGAMHRAALARGPGPSWDEIAARFEALAA